MQQVLIETIPFSVAPIQLTEGLKAPSGNPLVEGILATAEVKNGNGRYYQLLQLQIHLKIHSYLCQIVMI